MSLHRGRGQPIALADGIHFPMQDGAGRMVFCRVRYETLRTCAGPDAGHAPHDLFERLRAEIEAAARALYERGVYHITVEPGHLSATPDVDDSTDGTERVALQSDKPSAETALPMSSPPISPPARGD